MRRPLGALLLCLAAPLSAAPSEMRGLCVVRTGLTSPESVDRVVDGAERAGFTSAFVQVRGPYDAYAAGISDVVRHLWRQGAQVIVLGGDHGVTIPVLDALDALGEPVHVLHVDAHLDWREEVGGVRRGYSSPLRWASAQPAVSGMTQIGLRAIGSARRQEVEAARAYGSHLVTAEEFHRVGPEPVLATVPEGRAVYITIDADGLDPTEMPAVMAPTPGGLYFRQLAPLLRSVARRHRIVGMDLVEVAPSFDFANGLSCIMAGRLILNVLSASWDPGGARRGGQPGAAG